MKIRFKYTFLFILLLSGLMEAFSRADQNPFMQKAPANVKVDGKLTEWGDSLAMYDSKTKLNYTIANDDTMLYVAVFVTDRQLKRKIMAGGITISVNGQGKKNKAGSITYPIPDKTAFTGARNHEDDADDAPRPSLIEATSIRIAGFKEVESEVITTSNTYGFNAALGFDEKHNLVYETAIPLKLLHIKKGKNNLSILAVNIAINGMEKPKDGGGNGEQAGGGGRRGAGGGGMEGGGIGGGGGMGGGGMGGGGGRGGNRGGGGQSGDRSSFSQTSDFWVELALTSR